MSGGNKKKPFGSTKTIFGKNNLLVPPERRWRDDFQCGPSFPLSDGSPMECNGEGTNPCCSPYGWCDVTPAHCDCDGCIDYRTAGKISNYFLMKNNVK